MIPFCIPAIFLGLNLIHSKPWCHDINVFEVQSSFISIQSESKQCQNVSHSTSYAWFNPISIKSLPPSCRWHHRSHHPCRCTSNFLLRPMWDWGVGFFIYVYMYIHMYTGDVNKTNINKSIDFRPPTVRRRSPAHRSESEKWLHPPRFSASQGLEAGESL